MKKKHSVETVIEEQQQVSKHHVKKRTFHAELLLAILIAAFGLLATLAKQNPYFGFDLAITRAIQRIAIPGFDELMRIITMLGNFEWGILTVIALSLFFIALKKNFHALFLILSVVGTETLSVFFKGLIGRPRPDPELINQLGRHLYSDSFPSGHVLFYIGCYGFLLYLSFIGLKRGALRTSLITLFCSLLVLIGMSRIYVGAHWFSDTLGAYLIGSVWLFIVIFFHSKLVQKKYDK